MLAVPPIGKSGPKGGGLVAGSPLVALTGGTQLFQKHNRGALGFAESSLGIRPGQTVNGESQCILQDADSSCRTTIEGGIP